MRRRIIAVFFILCLLSIQNEVKGLYDNTNSTATFLEFNLRQNICKVDGKVVHLDVAPEIEKDRVLVPIRLVAEAMGCTVEWEQVFQQVTISSYTRTITMYVGSNLAYLKDPNTSSEIEMDVAPKLVNGCVLVPIRFVAENLHCQVYWEDQEYTVLIVSAGPGAKTIGADLMMTYLEETGKADAGSVIAVIDSGVDVKHPYLQNRIVQAYNVVEDNNNVLDERGHGTKVAGVIANCTPETVKIMPIKADDEGVFGADTIAKSINYAVENGAKVINISLNAAADRNNRIVMEAVTEAVRQGCSVIVAAGNDSKDVLNYSPSDSDEAIVVTAVNQNSVLWNKSNYGSTVVVTAPGVGVVSTMPGGAYGTGDGTSLAAPYVSAAVAMIRMDIPGITPAEVRNLLIDYSTDLGDPGWDPLYGGGLVDLDRYVTCRKNGVIGDLTKSAEEKIAELDKEIEAFRQEKLKEHLRLYGLFWNPLFATELDMEAMRLYNANDFFSAGYYFEKALGFYSDNTARNNLAYMIRRGEYVSYQYSIQRLLDQAKAAGYTHAYVNDALLMASKNRWEEADQIIAELCLQYSEGLSMKEAILTWKTLSYQKDAEGDLVLGWLMRHHVFTDAQYSQLEYMERALEKYPTLPEWMKHST